MITCDTSPCQFTTLNPGTKYQFYAVATNKVGSSLPAGPITATAKAAVSGGAAVHAQLRTLLT